MIAKKTGYSEGGDFSGITQCIMFCWAKWPWWIRHILCTSLCLHFNLPHSAPGILWVRTMNGFALFAGYFHHLVGRGGWVAWRGQRNRAFKMFHQEQSSFFSLCSQTVQTKSNCLCVHSRFCLKGQRMGDKVRHRYVAAQQEPLNFRFQALSKFNYGRQAHQG